MNRTLSVCFLGLALIVGISMMAVDRSVNQVQAAAQAAPLQRGISVQMVVTSDASAVPEADSTDAWIVTVTKNGDLYFGVDLVTPENLLHAMKVRPRNRGQELYIKADGRAPSASVRRVLEIAHEDFFRKVILLTAQPTDVQPGTIVPPSGLTLWIERVAAEPVVVHIHAGQDGPTLEVNNERIPFDALQRKLEDLLEGRGDRVVVLKAGRALFADMAQVVDVCNMAGAEAVLGEPEI